MLERRIQIEEGQSLTLSEMSTNVVVDAWDEADILVRLHEGVEEDLAVEATESGPSVSARTKCKVRVPSAVRVHIRQVRGNLTVTAVTALDAEQVRGNMKLTDVGEASIAEVYGNIKVSATGSLRVVGTLFGNADLLEVPVADLQNVRGNLKVTSMQRLRVSRIGGNLQAREIAGEVEGDQVGGNATLKDLGGPVILDQVAGNLSAMNLTGGAQVPKIGGNLALNGDLGPGRTYQFRVGGNALLRLGEGVNVHLTLKAKGHLKSSLLLQDEQRSNNTLSGTLGNGGAELGVEAGGNILLGGAQPPIGADLGKEISRQVEEGLSAIDLEAVGRHVSDEMDAAISRLRIKMESQDWERIGFRTQKAVERAMDRMQIDMDRLSDKAARQQEHLKRKAEREARRRERHEAKLRQAVVRVPEGDIQVEAMDPSPDLEEERLSILRMVEQGQVTPQEAELLLDALE